MDPILRMFLDEAAEQLETMNDRLVHLEDHPEDAEALEDFLRTAHNMKGGAGMAGQGAYANLVHEIEGAWQGVQDDELALSEAFYDLLFAALDRLRLSLTELADGPLDEAALEPMQQRLKTELTAATDRPGEHSEQTAGDGDELVLGEYDRARINALRRQGLQLFRVELELAASIEAFAPGARQLVRALRTAGDVVLTSPPDLHWDECVDERRLVALFGGAQPPQDALGKLGKSHLKSWQVTPYVEAPVDAKPQQQPEELPEPALAAVVVPRAKQQTSVRVGVSWVDNLVDIIGELVIVESMMANTPTAGSAVAVNDHLGELRRITQDLQDLGMRMRMVPLRDTFRSMRRLVRDVSKRLGKPVDFQIEGEETEIDRAMVERLHDPLVHMLRNALDHGLESPEERQSQQKPAQGHLHLTARQQGGSIIIELTDDGRGLDREAILVRARQRGLVGVAHQLTEEETHNLILAPGFSTAAEVTEISGRGVGLDVVRRNVEAMRGSLTVSSTEGEGTTFRLSLPITLAIIDGMLVACGDERYILPTRSIIKSVQPEAGMVFTQGGRVELLQLRGEHYPLVRLADVFGIPGAVGEPTAALVVVVEAATSRFALLVDDVLAGQQVVIKSLGQGLPNARFLSGAAILPDGQVGLILNVDELIKLEASPAPRSVATASVTAGTPTTSR